MQTDWKNAIFREVNRSKNIKGLSRKGSAIWKKSHRQCAKMLLFRVGEEIIREEEERRHEGGDEPHRQTSPRASKAIDCAGAIQKSIYRTGARVVLLSPWRTDHLSLPRAEPLSLERAPENSLVLWEARAHREIPKYSTCLRYGRISLSRGASLILQSIEFDSNGLNIRRAPRKGSEKGHSAFCVSIISYI